MIVPIFLRNCQEDPAKKEIKNSKVEKGNTIKGCENSFDITNGESSPNSFETNINPTKKYSLKRNQLRRVP